MTREELLNIAKPILFNTDMVRAILDERKAATRRKISIDIVNNCDVDMNGTLLCFQNKNGDFIDPVKLCRYQIGDILYVRETWGEWTDGYTYKAWNEPFPQAGCYPSTKWHPSIHMPKEAARIFLKVTDVRVVRLQNMTLDDFLNEGVSIPYEAFNDPENAYMQGKELFMNLWDSTIKKSDRDRYGWDANPWVWVIEFERVKENEYM